MRNHRVHLLLTVSVLVALLGGCAASADGTDGAAASGPSDGVRVGLLDYSFARSASTMQATEVTFTVTNAGGTGHDLQILDGEEVLGATRVLEPGEEQTITVDLTGLTEVTLLCTVPGHEAMGMVEQVAVVPQSTSGTPGASLMPKEVAAA